MLFTSFQYAFLKNMRLKSTWIILVLASLLIFGLAGLLPFAAQGSGGGPDSNPSTDIKWKTTISFFMVGTSLLLLIGIFAGFRGATVFRDEIEDGSFLIMLSKPISRHVLIAGKWLALLLLMLIYCFILALVHIIGMVIGSKNGIDASIIFAGIGIETAVGFIFALIFASIAILFSTFLSSTMTAVITLIFAILPILTSIVPLITNNESIKPVSEIKAPESYFLQNKKAQTASALNLYSFNSLNDCEDTKEDPVFFQERFAQEIGASIMFMTDNEKIANTYRFINKLNSMGVVKVVLPWMKGINFNPLDDDTIVGNIKKNITSSTQILNFFKTDDAINFNSQIANFLSNNLSYDSGSSNLFTKILFISISTQVSAIMSYIPTTVYGESKVNNLVTNSNGFIGGEKWHEVLDAEVNQNDIINLLTFVNKIDPAISNQSRDPKEIENQLTSDFKSLWTNKKISSVYTVKYVPFIDKKVALIIYLVIAIFILFPVFFIIKKINFK